MSSQEGAVGDYAGNVGDMGTLLDNGIFFSACWPVTGPFTNGPQPNGVLISTQKVYDVNGVCGPGNPDCAGGCRGKFCCSGPIIRWDLPLSFAGITDGLSNTFLIGEKHISLDELGKQGTFNYSGGSRGYGDGAVWLTEGPRQHVRAGGPGVPITRPDDPNDAFVGFIRFGSYHAGMCQFALSDGSARAISATINSRTLAQLCNRKDEIPLPGE